MATNQPNNLFAPPSKEELAGGMFAPPSKEELSGDMFAPPSQQEMASPGASSAGGRGDHPADSGYVSPREVDELAARHKIDPEYLHAWAPLLGVNVSGEGQQPQSLARRAINLGSEAFLGLPNWLSKKISASPAEEKAIDELAKLAQERKTGLQTGLEIASTFAVPGIGTPVKAGIEAVAGAGRAAKIATGAAVAAGELGTYEIAHSAKDEEAASLAHGMEVGGLLGAALGLGGAAFSRGAEKFRASGQRVRAATDAAEQELKSSSVFQLTKEYAMGILSAKEYIPAQAPREMVREMLGKIPVPPSLLREMGREGAIGPVGVYKATEKLLNERIERDATEFIGMLRGKTTPKTTRGLESALKETSVQGLEYADRQWNLFTRVRAASDAVARDPNLKALVGKNWGERAILFMTDGRNGAARWIDNKLGTDFTQLMDSGSNRVKSYLDTVGEKLMSDEAEAVLRETRGLDEASMRSLYEALDSGQKAEGQIGKLADWYRSKFSENWEELKTRYGMDLQSKFEGRYIPQKLVPATDVAATFRAWAGEAGGMQAWKSQIMDAADEVGASRLKALEFISGVRVINDATFERAFDIATNPNIVGERVTTKAKYLMERKGLLPSELIEKNVADLYTNWVTNTYKHVHMRDLVSELKAGAKLAATYGEKEASNYLLDLSKDMAGMRRGTANSWFKSQRMEWQTSFLKKMEEANNAGNTGAGAWYKFMASTPEFAGMLNASMYNSFLSLSPRAALQNMTQPLLMTVPEIGWGYGMKKLVSAYADLAKVWTAGEKNLPIALQDEVTAARFGKRVGESVSALEWKAMLTSVGKSSQKFNQEMVREHAQHLMQYAPYRAGEKLINNWNNVSMALFEGAERINRGTTALMAQGVARDLLLPSAKAADRAAAMRFVQNMDSSYRRSMTEALARKDTARVSTLLTNYLVGKTMFNYNQLTKSGFGRYVGPMLSVFTKWPTSVAGDIVVGMQERGVLGGMSEASRKYFAPLALMYGVQASLEGTDTGEAMKPFTGSQGLPGMTPISSVKPLLTGEIAAPPAVGLVRDIGLGLATADMYKVYRGINSAAETYVPVVPALLKTFVGMSSWMGGAEKPKGTLYNQLVETMGGESPDKEVRDFSKEIKESMTP